MRKRHSLPLLYEEQAALSTRGEKGRKRVDTRGDSVTRSLYLLFLVLEVVLYQVPMYIVRGDTVTRAPSDPNHIQRVDSTHKADHKSVLQSAWRLSETCYKNLYDLMSVTLGFDNLDDIINPLLQSSSSYESKVRF